MFFSPGFEQLDPALLAFIKCHITSPVRWEVLRVLASQDGAWLGIDQLARGSHRPVAELARALADLAADGVVESSGADGARYRLPADEPTSVVLHRLIEEATHNRELRAIIVAHIQHVRQQGLAVRNPAAA